MDEKADTRPDAYSRTSAAAGGYHAGSGFGRREPELVALFKYPNTEPGREARRLIACREARVMEMRVIRGIPVVHIS
jgi:hypothetical protein